MGGGGKREIPYVDNRKAGNLATCEPRTLAAAPLIAAVITLKSRPADVREARIQRSSKTRLVCSLSAARKYGHGGRIV